MITIRKFPWTIFTEYRTGDGPTLEEEYSRGIKLSIDARLRRQQPPLEEDVYRIPYFPRSVEMIGARMLEHKALKEVVQKDPLSAVLLLAADYENVAEQVEPMLFRNGEMIYEFLVWAKSHEVKLRLPIRDYEKALTHDPFWGIAYAEQTGKSEVLDDCIRFAHQSYAGNAGAAYLYLTLNENQDPVPLRNVLALDPFYALLASKRFAARGLRFRASNLRCVTARWAYHFLAFGLVEDRDSLVDNILNDPGWAIEWAKHSGILEKEGEAQQFLRTLTERTAPLKHAYNQARHDFCERFIAHRQGKSNAVAA